MCIWCALSLCGHWALPGADCLKQTKGPLAHGATFSNQVVYILSSTHLEKQGSRSQQTDAARVRSLDNRSFDRHKKIIRKNIKRSTSPGFEPGIFRSVVRRSNRCATKPRLIMKEIIVLGQLERDRPTHRHTDTHTHRHRLL